MEVVIERIAPKVYIQNTAQMYIVHLRLVKIALVLIRTPILYMLSFQMRTNTVMSFVLSQELLKRIQHQLHETIMLLFTKMVQLLSPIVPTIISTIIPLAPVRVMFCILVARAIEIPMPTEMLYKSSLFDQVHPRALVPLVRLAML